MEIVVGIIAIILLIVLIGAGLYFIQVGFVALIGFIPGLIGGYLILAGLQAYLFNSSFPAKVLAEMVTITFNKHNLKCAVNKDRVRDYIIQITTLATIGCIIITIVLLVLVSAHSELFNDLKAYGEEISKERSTFWAILLSGVGIAVLLIKANPLDPINDSIQVKLDSRIGSLPSTTERLHSLLSEVTSVSGRLGAAFSIEKYTTSLQSYINSHTPQIMVAPQQGFVPFVDSIIEEVQHDYTQLQKAENSIKSAEQEYILLSNTIKASDSFLHEEIDSLHKILNSESLRTILSKRQWSIFDNAMSLIMQLFQELSNYSGQRDFHRPMKSELLRSLSQETAIELQNKQLYKEAAILYLKGQKPLKAIKAYCEAGDKYEKSQEYTDAKQAYELALLYFQKHYGLRQKPVVEQISFYSEYIASSPHDHFVRFALARAYLGNLQWEEAFPQLQQVIDEGQYILQGKALLLRAQAFFGRAEGADIMLGLQDIERALSHYRHAVAVDELRSIAYQLVDAQYLQATGTQVRFPQEYQKSLELLLREIEQKYKELFETHEVNQAKLFECSDELKDQFPELATVILKNMVEIYRQQLQKEKTLDHNLVLDVALELRERSLDNAANALLRSMIKAYEVLFNSGATIESATLLSFAKKLQEYEYPDIAEQLMQTMVMTGYQEQFRKGRKIDKGLILSVSSELVDMEFEHIAENLLTSTVETFVNRLSIDSHQKLRSSADIHQKAASQQKVQEDEQELLSFALQLWQSNYHKLSVRLVEGIGGSYQQKITRSPSFAQQVMVIAEDFWKRAQEQPDISIFDTIAERLWQTVVTALESTLSLDNIAQDDIENYYWLFKAYQAVREPVKCGDVGLKILGAVGFQGYKDVRPIVDNLVTSGFQAQEWQVTGDGQTSRIDISVQPTHIDKSEQFGIYTGTYHTKGGMGEIYKGITQNGETVAIKRIPRYSLHGNCRERFLREIQVIQNISHPNIVKMLDVNEKEGYYVMEWAEDGTLEDVLIQSKTLSLKQALDITVQLADALEVVHQRDIVHRDIKPQNVLMFSNNIAKLTDFGVAHVKKVVDDPTLTKHGEQPGTPRYMSPEQRMGEIIDNKTDVFSLGLVLYEMITGQIPFANARELFQKDIEEILECKDLQLPEAVQDIVKRALRNNANRRYTANELKTAIEQVITEI